MIYKPGDIVKGTVTGIQPYGAFVVLPDHSTGLIHISEISDGFVEDVRYFVKVGEEIELKVTAADELHRQYRLSLKAAHPKTKARSRIRRYEKVPDPVIGFRSLETKLPEWIDEKIKEKNHD
ncbi:MAG: S1 RNA-binding domain-containing protein [Erysipelotrichales bacterium]|nr:S1 RNA-binding domain-containing protein [Erysipelotrichales bacterium]